VVPAALIPGLVLLLAGDQLRAPDSHVIAVSGALDQSCPAARQVTDALAARLPGFVLPNGQAARPGMLRLAVATDASGIRIDLADPDGAPLLHRVLAVARGPAECAALADTIAGRQPVIDISGLSGARFSEGRKFGSVWGPGNRA